MDSAGGRRDFRRVFDCRGAMDSGGFSRLLEPVRQGGPCNFSPGGVHKEAMYKLVFFVPSDAKEKVKDALFYIGAGSLGDYSRCSWECEGRGQFMPMPGSSPVQGEHNSLERFPEFRVEMLVSEELIPLCIETIHLVHPFEVPAFEFIRVLTDASELSGEEWL